MFDSLNEFVYGLLEDCCVDCIDYWFSVFPSSIVITLKCAYGLFYITQHFDNGQEITLIKTNKVPYEIMEFCNELRFRNAEGVIEGILKGGDEA